MRFFFGAESMIHARANKNEYASGTQQSLCVAFSKALRWVVVLCFERGFQDPAMLFL